jgi:hypothetical protein
MFSQAEQPLLAKVKINGQSVNTDAFSEAAKKQLEDVIAKLPHSWETPRSDPSAEAPDEYGDRISAASEVNNLHRRIGRLLEELDARFSEFLKANPNLEDKARDGLHDILMLTANRLMELAQQVDGRSEEAAA